MKDRLKSGLTIKSGLIKSRLIKSGLIKSRLKKEWTEE